MILPHCRLVIVGIGRHPVLHLKKVISIAVHIRLGRSGEAHHDRVKILENGPVFFENAAMALVNDDQVKVRRAKEPPPVPGLRIVNGIEDRGVGRKHDPGVPVVLVGAQIAQGHIRQIFFKIVPRLLDQGRAVGQEQDICDVSPTAEYIHQAGRRPRLACPGGHHQQVLPKPLHDLPAYRPDGLLLVVTVSNLVINGNSQQVFPLRPAVHQLLQVVFAENSADFPLGASLIVPKVRLEAVGGEHHGPPAKPALQAVGVQYRLFPAVVEILAGAFGLHHRQGQAILAKKHIVRVARFPHHAGHALHRVLLLHVRVRAVEFPARQFHVYINIPFPGVGLRGIIRHKGTLPPVLFLGRGELGGHGLDFLAQDLDLRVLFPQQTLLLPDLLCVHDHLFPGDLPLVKPAFLIVCAVAVVHPLDKFKQAAQGSQRVPRLDAALGVDGQVAQLDDKRQLAPGGAIHRKAEGRLMEQRLQVILVRHLHGVVRGVDPLHRQLQRLPAAHRAHGRGGRKYFLRLHRRRGKEGVGGLGCQEGEIGHGITSVQKII